MAIRHLRHIMAKPAQTAMRQMANLPWMAPARSPEALHWTVMPDPENPAWLVEVVGQVLADVDMAPFALVFDQARGRRGATAEIYCRKVPPEARRLVRTICRGFAAAGIDLKRSARPHVTLDYAFGGADFDVPIPAIVWEVDGLQLVESMAQQRRHIVKGRWPLVPRQGTLFPLMPCASAC
jgi:2'-5' RNA ligase